ncbi:MAG: GNAT family N-acetyltransferase [Chloroflexi bacterium]|nr:GNAT family N-acetyltransferase [Chloroflexota bacterium]
MSNSINIRPLAPADIPDLARWVAETPLWQRYTVTEKSFAERLRAGLASGATIFVAERDGTVLGFVWLVARGAFNRSAYIQLIGTRLGARSGGVGRALMEFAEARAESREMFLLVSDFNADAQKFYARLGYRQVGKLDDYVIQGVSELIFWKKLEREV